MEAHAASSAESATAAHIVLQPNRSLSRRHACRFFTALVLTDLALAAASLYSGAWPVLPFLLLQLVGIGALLWCLRRRAHDHEVITFNDRYLRVERHQGRHTTAHEFQRYWARVALRPVRRGWHPSRLLIRSHGREVEIGAELLEEQRLALARNLKQAVGRGDRPGEAATCPVCMFDNSRFKPL